MPKLNALAANPMFKLSLGSKELFHSNFLEFLWEQDKNKFIKMLEYLLKQSNLLASNSSKLKLDREKQNFDICIYHEDSQCKNKNKEFIDIIIENKVKSIPYKEQLDKYKEKLSKYNEYLKKYKDQGSGKKSTCILLSLFSEFHNKENIEKDWKIITYKDLAEGIKNYYDLDTNTYISDYVQFIEKLDNLNILEDFVNQKFYDPDAIESFSKHRLSDLYIKQRGSYFISLLKLELENKLGNNFDVIFSLDVKNPKFERNTILLKSEMFNGKSTITICIKLSNSDNLYEIQIEGDQYRHLFNHSGLINKRDNDKSNVESILNNMPYFYSNNFPTGLKPSGTSKGFNQYKPNCMYKYVKYSSELKVSEMLELIVEDTNNVIGYLDSCETLSIDLQQLDLDRDNFIDYFECNWEEKMYLKKIKELEE